MIKRPIHLSHDFLAEVLDDESIVVDATMGNGNDTLFFAELVGETGKVYAFDVQQQALDNTTKRLEEHHCLQQAQLFLKGHENIDTLIPEEEILSAAVFNLGYLPKSDKSIVTKEDTTIQALEGLLKRLKKKGRIVLVIYDGHDEGKVEKQEVLHFVAELPQEKYSVLNYQFINQRNNPPSLICIEKK